MNSDIKQKGFNIIELIIAIFILGIVIVGFYEVAVLSLKILQESEHEMRAVYLAEEGVEAVRSIRDTITWIDSDDGEIGLGELDIDVADTYYPIISGEKWELSFIDPGVIEGIFNRKIVFEKISRDPATGEIEAVYDEGHKDADSLKLSVVVNWMEKNVSKDITLVTLITNF